VKRWLGSDREFKQAMRLNAILYVAIMLMPVVCTARQNGRLEGCVNQKKIATVLGEMRQENSRPISEEQFRAMWPIELADVEIGSKTSRTLQSDDRILKGHCQCCEDFEFNVRQEGGAAPLELHGVIVNYSARRRGTLVEMAKLFARAVGLGEADLQTVGTKSSQDYQWEKIKGKERRAYVIELHFTREEGLWKMHFSTAFYVVVP
jgi:hypothetical protein